MLDDCKELFENKTIPIRNNYSNDRVESCMT